MHISISELLVILVVAILVIKPDRLPEVAFIIGKWMKKLQHFIAKMKREFNHHE